jgi:hypothetical protein
VGEIACYHRVVVFLELGFFLEKQFLEHPATLKIGRDLAQCPIVFNVLLYDKRFKNASESCRSRPLIVCARSIPLCVLCVINSKGLTGKPIATAPADA